MRISKITSVQKLLVRHESPPGDQAQFDWSPYNVPVDGVITTVYCFSMILSASRKKAVCFSLKADAAAIYEAIQELFEDLGGVTQELLIDNPTALVIENNPRNETEIRYNPHRPAYSKTPREQNLIASSLLLAAQERKDRETLQLYRRTIHKGKPLCFNGRSESSWEGFR
mgnify:CR=1 FL=1